MGRNKGLSGLLGALSRRRFMQGAAAMGLSITAMPKFAAAADEKLVNFYNWDTYIGETTLADFTKATGIEVKLDLFADNDELFAKLRGGNPGYDVIVPSGNWVARMSQADMLAPLDHNLIPNIRHITPRFINSSSFDPGRKFSLPYMWGTIGIGYRKSKFTEPPASWKWLYDSDKYAGRMALMTESDVLLGMALKYLGYSLNTTDDAQLAQAEALIIRQKPHIKAFAEDNGQDLLASGEVDLVMEWNGDIAQLMAEDPDIGYVVPAEGGVLWEDTLAIPKGAPHLQNAHAFINFLHEPEVNAGIATTVQYATPNQSALALMDASYTGNPVIFAPQSVIEKSETLNYLGEAVITKRQEACTRIFAA
jgi:spermidine/putrescine transport system substrate-binding protein